MTRRLLLLVLLALLAVGGVAEVVGLRADRARSQAAALTQDCSECRITWTAEPDGVITQGQCDWNRSNVRAMWPTPGPKRICSILHLPLGRTTTDCMEFELRTRDIFADGFESGDASAWSFP